MFAKEQLGKCISSAYSTHANCESGITSLPTRILHIEKVNGEYNVRLFITKGLKGRYVTLSHCWGSQMKITTISANIDERVTGIRWEDLSHTFQDAVHITHELGFKYLWIDALCIIQHDLLDWQHESGQMYAVYSNCALMISADHAADGQGGCFNSPASNLWLVRTSDQEAQVAVRRAKYHAGFFRANRFEGYKHLAPLATRAWAFQECTLAPRVLHFAADELFWTCGGNITCQCGGLTRDCGLGTGSKKFMFKGCGIDGFVENIWYGLLGDYLPRLLTKPEDRLPAMSGLAKCFDAQWKMMKARYVAMGVSDESFPARITTSASTEKGELNDTIATTVLPKEPGTYLAGLWSNYLDTGLQWTRPILSGGSRISSPLVSKPSSYLAPSWSWASINAAAQYTAPREPIQGISIIHAACTPDGLDPMGTVKDGKLVLSGPVIPFKLMATIALPEFAADTEQSCILRDYTGRDVSANYVPDYAFSREDMWVNGLGTRDSLDVYGLVMSPDFVMVLRRLSTDGEDVYERIGSLNYLEGCFECYEQPKEGAQDSLRKELTII